MLRSIFPGGTTHRTPRLRLRRKPHPTATPRLGDQRRFEVLVRSTYRDLQEARQRVTMTLLERDAFPSGMEICSPGMHRNPGTRDRK